MDRSEHAQGFALLEVAVTILFCLVDDVYQNINPDGRRYERLKKLSDSEVITLVLFQQLRGIESQRSFLRDLSRFFSHLFPGVVGLAPSSLHSRIRKLRNLGPLFMASEFPIRLLSGSPTNSRRSVTQGAPRLTVVLPRLGGQAPLLEAPLLRLLLPVLERRGWFLRLFCEAAKLLAKQS